MRAKILWATVLSLFFNLIFLGADVGNPPPIRAALNEWENIQGQTLTATNGNISQNSGGSQNPSLVLDSAGSPCIAWSDNTTGNFEIYFARWNGSSWVNASGALFSISNGNISKTPGTSEEPSLVLDSTGNPSITWMDNTYSGLSWEILYIRWSPTINNWICANGATYIPGANGAENVSRNSSQSRSPMVILDNYDKPHIAWNDGMNSFSENDVYYVKWDNSINNWTGVDGVAYIPNSSGSHNVTPTSIDNDFGCFSLDSKGNPHITWTNVTGSPNDKISYVKYKTNIGWVCANGTSYMPTNAAQYLNILNSNSFMPYIVTDINDIPHIVWSQSKSNAWGVAGDEEINYIKWDSSKNIWVCVDDSNYNPNTPGMENISNTPGASICPIIKIDSSGSPCIAWIDYTLGNHEVFYNRWSGTSWISSNISNTLGASEVPDLFLDLSSYPYVTWQDATPGNNEIYLAKWHGVPQNDIDKFIKAVDTDSDNDFDDELSKVSIGDEIRYKLTITFTKSGVAGEIMDFVPEGTAFLGMESGHKTPTSSYSDGKDWLYYSKNSEPDNNYAKRNGAVLKWKLNSDDGLSQEIIYKVKVTSNFNEELQTMGNFSLHGKTTTQSNTDLKVVKAYESVFNSQSTQASFYSNSLISPANSLDLEITDPIKDQWWTIGTGMNIRWNPPVANPMNCLTFSVKVDTNNDNTPDTEMLSKTYQTPIGEGYACVVIDRSTWENKKPLKDGKKNSDPGDSFEGLLTVTYWKWDKSSNSWVADGTKTVNIKITKYPVLNYAAWADPDYGLTRYDDRHPMVLIHGLSFFNPGGESQLWDALLNFMKQSPAVSIYGKKYKPYVFQYDSGDTFWGGANPKGIEAIGKQLLREIKRNYIDLEYAQNEGGLYLIGHSMGGLVARSFMREPIQEHKKNGPFCGDGVTRLITLATPHHGSGGADILKKNFACSSFIDDLTWDDYEFDYFLNPNIFLKRLNNPENKNLLYKDKIIALACSDDEFVPVKSALFYAKNGSETQFDTNHSRIIDIKHPLLKAVVSLQLAHIKMLTDQQVLNTVKQFLHAPITSCECSIGKDYLALNVYGQGFGDRIGKTSFKIVPINPLLTSPIIGSMEWSNERISVNLKIQNKMNSKNNLHALQQMQKDFQENKYKVVINIEGNGPESSTSEDFPNANIVEIEPVKKDVELSVIPSKSVYCRGDTINMKLRVRNNSKLKITNPQLFLMFPKELTLLSSRPQGSATQNKWSINIGNLNGGSVLEAELKFKLKEGYSIPEQGINLSFTASFTSFDIDLVQDHATVKYVSCTGTENISMTILWTGFNTKTNIAKTGEEISAKVMPEGGSSPYEILFDWGDGTRNKASEITSENFPTFKHTFNSQGEYNISVTCLDQYGKQCIVARKIIVK